MLVLDKISARCCYFTVMWDKSAIIAIQSPKGLHLLFILGCRLLLDSHNFGLEVANRTLAHLMAQVDNFLEANVTFLDFQN